MKVAALSGIGLAFIALASSSHHARLIWNATASAPRGLYLLQGMTAPQREALVLVAPPAWVRDLAAERGYLPRHVPLIKRVAAIAGDTVCSDANAIRINGVVATYSRAADEKGRPLPHWNGCQNLSAGSEFLLMPSVPDSFDGRYFGATPTANNLGRLIPLWTY